MAPCGKDGGRLFPVIEKVVLGRGHRVGGRLCQKGMPLKQSASVEVSFGQPGEVDAKSDIFLICKMQASNISVDCVHLITEHD